MEVIEIDGIIICGEFMCVGAAASAPSKIEHAQGRVVGETACFATLAIIMELNGQSSTSFAGVRRFVFVCWWLRQSFLLSFVNRCESV